MVTRHKVIKVLNDCNEFEQQLNKFAEELNSFATQTHVSTIDGDIYYHAVLFYKG